MIPFIKWAGGKRQLLTQIQSFLPNTFNRYYEPFVGAGALFFNLNLSNSYISDLNLELINTYKIIKNNVKDLIEDLKIHINTRSYFEELRSLDRKSEYENFSEIKKASRFIALNKLCYNGLCRFNAKNQFNTPYGNYKNPKIYDEQNLLDISSFLQTIEITDQDFSYIDNFIQSDDFVYFDPPYMPITKTANFTAYTKTGFNYDEQVRLRDFCDKLTSKNVKFILSNSDCNDIRQLYKIYNINIVSAKRSINSDGMKRHKINELLIKNY